jgi:hypothetical protein
LWASLCGNAGTALATTSRFRLASSSCTATDATSRCSAP